MLINPRYLAWPTRGWYVYHLEGSKGSYIGISSQPERRWREHKGKGTVGVAHTMTYFYVGYLWRALDIESALHKMPNEDMYQRIFKDQRSFTRYVLTIPPSNLSTYAPYLRALYLKELAA